ADLLNYGYWNVTPDALGNGTYDLTLKERGYTNEGTSPNAYAIVTRTSTSSDWYSSGIHKANTQSESGGMDKGARSSLRVSGNFAIGFSAYLMAIQLLYFNAAAENNSTVHVTW